jgi:transcriptional regulator with XRE-family HTH domain
MITRAAALGRYLTTRRGLVRPEDAGLPHEDGRRVSGLRRTEVAVLADVSADYYLRLEQGRDQRPSEAVLAGIGRALRLDEHAMDYLFRLAYDVDLFPAEQLPSDAQQPSSAGRPVPDTTLLDHWSDTGAYITDGNRDIVASNALARRVGGGLLDVGQNDVLGYFDDRIRTLAPQWEAYAPNVVAALRYTSDPSSPRLQEIVDELTRRSPLFTRLWARHDARPLAGAPLRASIDGFGTVELQYQHLVVPDWPGHQLTTIFAEPGTPGSAVLAYLAVRTD